MPSRKASTASPCISLGIHLPLIFRSKEPLGFPVAVSASAPESRAHSRHLQGSGSYLSPFQACADWAGIREDRITPSRGTHSSPSLGVCHQHKLSVWLERVSDMHQSPSDQAQGPAGAGSSWPCYRCLFCAIRGVTHLWRVRPAFRSRE